MKPKFVCKKNACGFMIFYKIGSLKIPTKNILRVHSHISKNEKNIFLIKSTNISN